MNYCHTLWLNEHFALATTVWQAIILTDKSFTQKTSNSNEGPVIYTEDTRHFCLRKFSWFKDFSLMCHIPRSSCAGSPPGDQTKLEAIYSLKNNSFLLWKRPHRWPPGQLKKRYRHFGEISFWRNIRDLLHQKLSIWQLPVQSVMMILLKQQHFHSSDHADRHINGLKQKRYNSIANALVNCLAQNHYLNQCCLSSLMHICTTQWQYMLLLIFLFQHYFI